MKKIKTLGISGEHKIMRKRLPYKTEKWEKTKNYLIKDNKQYPVSERFAKTKKRYLDGKIGKIRFHNVLSLDYSIAAQEAFALGQLSECRRMLEQSVEEFLISVNEAQNLEDDDVIIREDIKDDLKSEKYGYYAVLLDRYDDVPVVTDPDGNLYKLIVGKENIDESKLGDFLDDMLYAISVRDSEMFEEALRNRIKEIRTNSFDFGMCADFYSMALIKEALKAEMTFYRDYVEVDFGEK